MTSGLASLRVLLVDFNKLRSVDRSTLPDNLQRLSLTFNAIEQIGSSSEQPDSGALQYIDLNHNKLTQLTATSLPSSIVSVNASYNDISTIDDAAFHNCAHLTELDLSHNQLTQLKKEAFSRVTNGANIMELQVRIVRMY